MSHRRNSFIGFHKVCLRLNYDVIIMIYPSLLHIIGVLKSGLVRDKIFELLCGDGPFVLIVIVSSVETALLH